MRSDCRAYLKKNGYPHNQVDDLATYLQGNAPGQYEAAVTFAKNGQFGQPVDLSSQKAITIDIVDSGKEGTSCASTDGCYSKPNVVVKVGTTITWVNKATMLH